MARQISPFHSADSKVYHVYGSCSSGKAVKKRQKGVSGRMLCKTCKDIRAGKRAKGEDTKPKGTDSTGPEYTSKIRTKR